MTAQYPEPSPRPVPPGGIRASHDDREAVVERLRDAAAEGRIDFDELDSRLELALTAKTHGELATLTADLPVPHSSSATASASAAGSRPPLVLKGGMFGASLGPGRWEVPGHVIAHGGVGGVTLDFTRVECRLAEVVVEAYAETSGVTVVIPDGWVADTSGIDPGIGGLTDKTTSDRLPGTPLIRLTGSGTMGGVVIRHPNKRERRKLDAS
ncbi:DUF1707 domain-containing protein [Streptomyces sp. CA-278952]|uniref:DUF1707 SHOCT-like domain-containing protein n=1 Tax=unclassified Streptomyces TaxID=2593676 RepID=UPI002241BC5C|nr:MULTISPECIES: DUF1707 domain-containing protein [unclassified Streptomyces]UZI29614.1 DUF1707 domain-containing protein [Streptomyces sp. VB1]WDG29576.1 DUF1707 domain-containing protein [Streptomyces sp. CA-278952]